jgi:iron complex transport system ATP-binding protein
MTMIARAPHVRLAAEGVSVSVGGRVVVSDVDLAFDGGEIVAVIGANGAGKSTLLKGLAGLQPVSAGRVLVDGADIAALDPRARARRIAYLPQERTLGWPISVARVVALGRLPHAAAMGARPSAADAAAIEAALAAMDLTELAQRPASALSGGELARVLLARTLAQEAPILIADEPTAGLDMAHVLQLFTHLRELAAAGRAVIVAVHDLSLALRYCHRSVLLSGSRVLASGPSRDVVTPANLATAFGVVAEVRAIDDVSIVRAIGTLT